MDLLDWHRGRLSSRRLAVLVKHLPRDSATLQKLHGEASQWSVGDYLLASVVDRLAEANWMFATVNRDEDADPLDHPEPVPRPATAEDERTGPAPTAAASPSGASPSSAAEPVRNPTPTELAQFFS
ncbi:hypothetical protein PV726_27740 [Streptomyces europaeiscabiei]|uniref:hypothetical protein n=1 Tax=Streptomyces europaeiscabiei TaxID=146819 RepID=UPI0029A29A69|nr:hypothetical protein [Streptomyces europaeiscabiei]MDX3694061.1 hypothetical protein [Streptomyces europaeiscabiei]